MSENKEQGLYNLDTIAKVLMLSPTRLSVLSNEGIIPRYDGKYRLIEAVQGYIRFLRKGDSDEAEALSLSREKAMLVRMQRARLELEFDILQRKLIRAEEVEEFYAEKIKLYIQFLETLPDRMEKYVALNKDQIRFVERGIRELRQELYEIELKGMVEYQALKEMESDIDSTEMAEKRAGMR